MLTFPGWREVGRAMRWARRQEGVRQEIEHGVVARQHRWYGPGRDGSIVGVTWGGSLAHDVDIYVAGGKDVELLDPGAAGALHALAALDLIPAELAEVAEVAEVAAEPCEHFTLGGVCQKCFVTPSPGHRFEPFTDPWATDTTTEQTA